MYQVLARKYRPKVLDEIIGQDSIVRILKNAVSSNRIAHAFIFSGTRGVGKTSIARILAKSINCVHGPTPQPCGTCEPCITIQNGNSVDVLEIDGASNTGVDAIRDLKENIIYTPQSFKYKIYIIDEVHMLSNSAFNALLKTLEEPPAHAKFIFATTELHKVPETILSRCQRLNFKRIPTNIIFSKLKEIAEKEKVVISDENIMSVASFADGSIRDSLSAFDTIISYYGNDIKEEDVSPVLGLTVKKTLLKLIIAIFQSDLETALGILKDIHESGSDMRQFIKQLAFYIRNILLVKLKYKDLINDLTEDEVNLLKPVAEIKTEEELMDMIDILIASESKYQKVSSPLLMFELIVFKLVNIPDKTKIKNLLDKIYSIGNQSNVINKIQTDSGLYGPATSAGNAEAKPANAQNSGLDKLLDHFNKIDGKYAKKPDDKNIRLSVSPQEEPAGNNNNAENSFLDNIKDVFKGEIKNIEKLEK